MYFVIAKLDENHFIHMNYLVNFGVSLDCIHLMQLALESGGDLEEVTHTTFNAIPFQQLLKIHKYFSWADKKLHQVFYIENKDDISEDLLSEFKDPDNEQKFVKPKVFSKNAPGVIDKAKLAQETSVIVKKDDFISEHDYLFGKKREESKIIDVKSQ
jgi:hypothetical protein